jgi:hypothetical protein
MLVSDPNTAPFWTTAPPISFTLSLPSASIKRTDVVIHGSRNQSSFTYQDKEHDYVSAKNVKKRKGKKSGSIRQIEVYHDKLRFSV